jgi:hypothetical protein
VLDYSQIRLSGFRKKGIEDLVMGVEKSRYAISRQLQVQCGATGVGGGQVAHCIGV